MIVDAETISVVVDAEEIVRVAEIEAEAVLLLDGENVKIADDKVGLLPLEEIEEAGDVVKVRVGLILVTFEVVGVGDEDRVLEGRPVVLLQSELDEPGTTKGEIVAVPVFVNGLKLELELNEKPVEEELVEAPPRAAVSLVGLKT